MKQKVIVIGGGPAGYHSALSCKTAGMDVTLIEQSRIGGTCTHKGCIPTRAYLSAIKAKAQLAGVTKTSETDLAIDRKRLATETQKKINQLAFGMEYMLNRKKVVYIPSCASITAKQQVTLSDGSRLPCDHIIIATGSKPVIPTAHAFTRLYTDEELLTLENLPEVLTIVGAGVLGVELAVIMNGLGVNVTLAEKESRILPDWDEDISRHMQTYLENTGIKICTNVEQPQGENGVFCIGRHPKLPVIDDSIDTDASWLHIIGDAAGGWMTADASIAQGRTIAMQITNPDRTLWDTLQAKCLFTPLEAASVGALPTPDDIIAYQDLGYTPTGVLFDADLGFIKIVIDKYSRVIKGLHIVSNNATEIIQVGQLAIAQKMTVDEFCNTIFPHPTECELLKDTMRLLK